MFTSYVLFFKLYSQPHVQQKFDENIDIILQEEEIQSNENDQVENALDEFSHFFEYHFKIDAETEAVDSAGSSVFIHTNANRSEANKTADEVLSFVDSLIKTIIMLNLKKSDTNSILKWCSDLIKNVNKLNLKLIEDHNGMSAQQVLEATTDLICGKIYKLSSTYRRKNEIESDQFYVAPKEVAIGTRFELKKVKRHGKIVKIPRLIQSSFQYISISETIKALFRRADFRDMYFKHNYENDHVCRPGEYKYFCCGSTFRKTELFQRYPGSLQKQIYTRYVQYISPYRIYPEDFCQK